MNTKDTKKKHEKNNKILKTAPCDLASHSNQFLDTELAPSIKVSLWK